MQLYNKILARLREQLGFSMSLFGLLSQQRYCWVQLQHWHLAQHRCTQPDFYDSWWLTGKWHYAESDSHSSTSSLSLTPTISVQNRWAAALQSQHRNYKPSPINSAQNRWAAALLTQREWLSLTPTPICTQQGDFTTQSLTAQGLSEGNAEAGCSHRLIHSSMTQHWKLWVWLSTQASPQPKDSAYEMLSLALHTGLSTAQWLSIGNAESGSLPVNYQDTVTQQRRCWVQLYHGICTEKGLAPLPSQLAVGWWAY